MTKHSAELEAKMSPEARARSDALHRKYVTEMPLNDSPPSKAYASVWDALSDSAAEAAILKVRSELMQQLATLIQERGWAGAEAVRHSGIDPSRADDLLRGRVSSFTLDALVNIAAELGQQVRVCLESR
ncbi:helix-turn-helix domain-containing protein [Luteimonas sp. XNQY3]|nr:XRE family transcriptional regulator [Luteimonas sp. XNQY3]MCD9005687.1 helix-turn-helix domain-containing protein [Luteimonas sp. XNQY3]